MTANQEQFMAMFQSFMATQEQMLQRVLGSEFRDQRMGEGHRNEGGKLVARHFKIDRFNGDAHKWDDWSFKLKRIVNSMNRAVCQTMTEWESKDDEINEDTDLEEDLENRSAELYDILCEHCDGEALMIVRQVEEMCGIQAWQKLHHKYNPKTMARGLRMLSEAVNPPRAKNLAEVETLVTKWEEKIKRLELQYNEKVSDGMKMAIFTNTMPAAIQDYIYTHADKETQYMQLREKVRAMIGNKMSMSSGPTPMDIGVLGRGEYDDHYHCDEYCSEDYEVDGVNDDICRKCGGHGHYARECPTKGKGKSNYGVKGKGDYNNYGVKGKGNYGAKGKGDHYNYGVKGKGDHYNNYGVKGKGDHYNYGYDVKGKGKGAKGKGYQGTCWNCGKVGHKANECNVRGALHIEEEDEECVEGVGGVWEVLVAGVSSQHQPHHRSLARSQLPLSRQQARQDQHQPNHRSLAVSQLPPGMVTTTDDLQEAKVVTNNPQAAKVVKRVYTSGVATPATTTWKSVATRRAKTTTLPPGLEMPSRSHTTTHNMFAGLQDDHMDVNEVETCGGGAWTRLSSMTFNLAGVTKPLASAAQVVASGNRIILDPKPECSYVENVSTGERMGLREQKGVYVFDVQHHDGQEGTITLDSGAGVSVWPKDWTQHIAETLPRKPGLKLVAANGTPIENVGRARVMLKGKRPGFSRPSQ